MMRRFIQFFVGLMAVTCAGLFGLSIHPALAGESPTPTADVADGVMRGHLLDLFAKTDCQLPCFLGLEPGISSGDEVAQLAAQFNANSASSVLTPKAAINYDLDLFFAPGWFSVNFWGQHNQLARINVVINDPEQQLIFNNPLSFSAVLHSLGTPSDVYVALQSSGLLSATLTLVYSDTQVMVQYMVLFPLDLPSSSRLSVCPSAENVVRTEAWLQRKSDSKPIVSYLEPAPNTPDTFGSNWTLQRMTGMDIDSFVKLFSDDAEACFEVLSTTDLYKLGYHPS